MIKIGKIKVMNESLANKIAAGEVVEKCVSVVKELVENSIDAGSTNIKIELKASGTREIKVIDNGSGMGKEDAVLAFSSYATSKINNEDDLYNIATLGFRGEALPSIASVSELSIKTSTGDMGSIITFKGGKMIKEEKGDGRKGTMVTVKNLFYNTPARLKHLGSLYYELAHITNYINKIALSHPDIAFNLSNDGKTIIFTDGSNNQLKVIKAIYGLEVAKKMIKIESHNDDYHLSGFISYPEITRSNRNHFITLVNGRVVKNIGLNKAINDAYHTYKPKDRYPIVVLNIKADSSLIDVNIHPSKIDVKFSKLETLKKLIEQEITNKLNSKLLIPQIEIKPKKEADIYQEIKLNLKRPIKEEELKYYEEEKTNKIENIIEYKESIQEESKLPLMYVVGLVKGTYIVCQNELGMYLIDQHAANERINYEYYLKKLGAPKTSITPLLLPINIEFPPDEFIIIKENMALLKEMGFETEEFGINTITIKAHPLWLPENYEAQAIRKIIDLIIKKEQKFEIMKFNERIAISISCKLAIKGNTNLSIREMESLIDRLRECQNPYTCPHGRPVIIFYSSYELEKLFKRVM